MGAEWRAIGLRGMYGYTADLATEPRWYRVHETFTEDADLGRAHHARAGRPGLQGGPVSPSTSVALTIKHFPGGGPQEMGLDPHYSFGKRQVYPGGRFADHMKPFIAAIDAGVSSVMPYYGVPVNVTHQGVRFEETGFAFSRAIVTDLLRDAARLQGLRQLRHRHHQRPRLGPRAADDPGARRRRRQRRHRRAVRVQHERHHHRPRQGRPRHRRAASTKRPRACSPSSSGSACSRIPTSTRRRRRTSIGSAAHRARGLEVQKQSIVLLENRADGGRPRLPLPAGAKVYTMGMGKADVERYGFVVTDGNAAPGQTRPSAAGHDVAIIRVQVRNANTSAYRSKDPATGANPARLNPRTGKPWGAEDPCVLFPDVNPNCTDDGRMGGGRAVGLLFGGALPWEANNLSFTAMAASESWQITPSLADIQAVMREVGPRRTVLAIYFRNPYVLDDASGLKEAGAIVAGFGVSDTALLEVVSGRFTPIGKLPFALARTLQAVIDNEPDVPGYPAADTLYPFGFGLTLLSHGFGAVLRARGALPSPPAGPRPWRVASRRRRRRASCRIRDAGRPAAAARRRCVRARARARGR